MGKIERAVIRHSVSDVIRVLENEPVRPDMVVELTAAQVMNRVSIAHLSIERAMKFVITEAGGPLIKDHDLPSRLNELRQCEPESAKFLGDAFEDAVRHYRYNANATYMKHLKSLDAYLNQSQGGMCISGVLKTTEMTPRASSITFRPQAGGHRKARLAICTFHLGFSLDATGSDENFQNIRYWELTQSTNEMILRTTYITLHMELLHAMSEILLAPERPKDTVSTRVERAVRDAMFSNRELSYSPSSEKERSVQSYIKWLKGNESFTGAISHAFKKGSIDQDEFRTAILREAHRDLSTSADPAVRYFAETLTVLPKQQRDAIPCVEWLGQEKYRSGIVSTPGGKHTGIHRSTV